MLLSIWLMWFISEEMAKCNLTLVCAAKNDSIITCGDFKMDLCEALTPPTLALMTYQVIVAVVGWQLSTWILSYIKTKPPGMQSLMDIPNTFQFWYMRIYGVMWLIFTTLNLLTLDSGDIMAKIIMWPLNNFHTIVFLTTILTPVTQVVLIKRPGIELPITDDMAFGILNAIILVFMMVANVICHYIGWYPSTYYILRSEHLAVANHVGPIVRIAFAFSCIGILWTARLYIYCKGSLLHMESNELVRVEAVAVLQLGIVMLTLVHYITPNTQLLAGLQGGVVLFIYPLAVVAFNSRLQTHIFSRNPRLVRVNNTIRWVRNRNVIAIEQERNDQELRNLGRVSLPLQC